MTCVSIGFVYLLLYMQIVLIYRSTGMKCLSSNKYTPLAKGHLLHDWHAEILAIRALNFFLLKEACALASCEHLQSSILRRRTQDEVSQESERHAFTILDDLYLIMYSSEAPCGDASMELVMEAQRDATPWPVAAHEEYSPPLLGRGSFSQLGVVRRKPGKKAHSDTRWISLSRRSSCR